MELFNLTNNLMQISSWSSPTLKVGFTTRLDGTSNFPNHSLNMAFHVNDNNSNVLTNRKLVANQVQMSVNNWVGAEQTHETNIEVINKDMMGLGSIDYESALKRTDGLFTTEKNILLTLCFADCVPLFFKDKNNQAIGLAHAGWKSTVGEIGPKMVNYFLNYGISIDDIEVVIGPAICEQCYEVDGKVINIVQNILVAPPIIPYNQLGNNSYLLDLKLLNKILLIQAGVKEENIKMSNYCSSCHNELFFSHRKEKGVTGRMMSFIGFREDSNESITVS